MNFMDAIDQVELNIWLRWCFRLIGLIAAYLAIQQADWAPVFWGLLALCVVITIIPFFKRWQLERRRRSDLDIIQQYHKINKFSTIDLLISEFSSAEKARRLIDSIEPDCEVRAVLILPIEDRIGVILDIGKDNGVEVGTSFVIYRTDTFAQTGDQIEQQLAVVKVTSVQVGNNCSQAQVIIDTDSVYWSRVRKQLHDAPHIVPPKNIAQPHIPSELSGFSLEYVVEIRELLSNIRASIDKSFDAPVASMEELT